MTGERDFLDGLEELLPHLRRYARALTRDPDGADDLVQDTLERAIARRDRYRPGTSLRSWSFTLMHNLHIDQCRGRQRRGPVLPYDETFDPRVADGEPMQFWAINLREFLSEFRRLRQDEQEVMLLVGVRGMAYHEAARQLGIALGTVKSRVFRARARLREAGCAV